MASDPSVHQRILQLEQELIEFQESSKELEQALEEELLELQHRNQALEQQIQSKDTMISTLSKSVANLTLEINELMGSAAEKYSQHEKIVTDLKNKLVYMEILNNDVAEQGRVLDSKYQLATQFSNQLLEKIALVESELEIERNTNAQNRLITSNFEMGSKMNDSSENSKLDESKTVLQDSVPNASIKQIRTLNDSQNNSNYRKSDSYFDVSSANGTVLDIGEMLASEPPQKYKIPSSESPSLLQELYTNSVVLRRKVGEVNLALKTSSKIQLTSKNAASDALTPTLSVSEESPKVVARKKTTLRGLVRGILKGGS